MHKVSYNQIILVQNVINLFLTHLESPKKLLDIVKTKHTLSVPELNVASYQRYSIFSLKTFVPNHLRTSGQRQTEHHIIILSPYQTTRKYK